VGYDPAAEHFLQLGIGTNVILMAVRIDELINAPALER
jgi:hypothetical protein